MRHWRPFLLVLIAGTRLEGQASTCQPETPSGATVFDQARIAALAGSYDLVLIDTTGPAIRRIGYDIVLWPNDSLRRYQYVRQIGREPGERHLGGTARSQDTSHVHYRNWTGPDNPGWSIMFLGKVLRIGTIDAMDGWDTALEVRWVSPVEFGGEWTSHSGIAMTVDSLGRRLPDPSGYFCARRVPRFPDAPRPP